MAQSFEVALLARKK